MSDTPVVLMRNSERVSFRRCGFKWDLSYNRTLEPTRSRPALSFGTLIHEALAPWYPPGTKRGIHPCETFAKLYAEIEDPFSQFDDEGNRVPAYDLGMAMLEGYIDKWGDEPHVDVIAPEMSMEIDILDKRGNYLCTWVGQGDLCYRDLNINRLGWKEHKTAKSLPDRVAVNTQYGDQGVAYDWAGTITLRHMGILSEDEHVDFIEYNFLRKSLPDARPRNEQGHYLNKPSKEAIQAACAAAGLPEKGTVAKLTDSLLEHGWTEPEVLQLGEPSMKQPPPLYFRDRMNLTPDQTLNFQRRIREEAWLMAQVRAGKSPVLKNPQMDCERMCDFFDVCELHEMGADWESVLDFEFRAWDPYSNHEIKAGR